MQTVSVLFQGFEISAAERSATIQHTKEVMTFSLRSNKKKTHSTYKGFINLYRKSLIFRIIRTLFLRKHTDVEFSKCQFNLFKVAEMTFNLLQIKSNLSVATDPQIKLHLRGFHYIGLLNGSTLLVLVGGGEG